MLFIDINAPPFSYLRDETAQSVVNKCWNLAITIYGPEDYVTIMPPTSVVKTFPVQQGCQTDTQSLKFPISLTEENKK